jgi:flagellar assembly protein FliH
MLSRVLRGDETTLAAPLPWKSAAGSKGPALRAASAAALAAPANSPANAQAKPPGTALAQLGDPSRQIVTTHDQVEVLQARVAELERDMEQRIRQAREAAYKEGEHAARTQVQPQLEKMARSIQEIADLRPKLRHQAEGDLLKLALAIARKVVHREITADPEALTALVRVAIEKIRLQEIVRVRTHPLHQQVIQQIVSRLSSGAQLEIQADQRLPLGGVIIDTARGEFDASVDVQLREIERGLTDRLATFEPV